MGPTFLAAAGKSRAEAAMSKLDARADRVRIIAHTLFGTVLSRDGHLMTVEVPADLLGAAMGMLSRAASPCRPASVSRAPAWQPSE
jgi:hypothetical protein